MASNENELSKQLSGIIAKAWMDPSYKQKLIDQPVAVMKEAGIPLSDDTQITVHEDSDSLKHLVLDSSKILPGWDVSELPKEPNIYQAYAYAYAKSQEDENFKSAFVNNPLPTLEGLGMPAIPGVDIKVFEDTDDHKNFVIPAQPSHFDSGKAIDAQVRMLGDSTNVNVNANVDISVNTNVLVNVDTNTNAAINVDVAATVAVIVAVLI